MKNSLPRSILYGFLSMFLPLVSTFLVTPYIVRGLGAAEYGLLTLVLGFINYSFTFGIGRTVTKYVSEYRSTGDFGRVSEALAAALFLNLLVGALGAAILAWLAQTLVTDVLLIENQFQTKAVIGFYIAAATVSVLMLQQVFSAVLQAVGRFDWFSILTVSLNTMLILGNLVLVLSGGDSVTLLIWNLLLTLAGAAAFFLAAKKLLPEARFGFRFSREVFAQTAQFSGSVVIYQLFANVFFLFERSWITRNLGAESLTLYAVPMTLAMYIHVFVISLSMSLMPLASEAGARQDSARLRRLYERAAKYVALVVVFVCTALIVGSRAFLHLWLGADFAERSTLALIFHVLTFGSMAFGFVAWQLSEGLGFPSRNAAQVIFWAVSGTILMIWLTPQFGIAGAAAARAVGVVVALPIFIGLIERRTFGKILFSFWQKTLSALIPGAAAGAAVEYFLLERLPLNWFGFAAAVAAGGLVFLGFLIVAKFFTPEEKLWLRQFAARATVTD